MSRVMRYATPKSQPSQTLLEFLCDRFSYFDQTRWTSYIEAGIVTVHRLVPKERRQQLLLQAKKEREKTTTPDEVRLDSECSSGPRPSKPKQPPPPVEQVLPCTPDMKLQQQDQVRFNPPRELEPEVDSHYSVVHEDQDIIVVVKSGNLPVSESGRYAKNTLQFILTEDLTETAQKKQSTKETDHQPHVLYVVHRLDKETSGIVVFAKTLQATRHLAAQFQNKSSLDQQQQQQDEEGPTGLSKVYEAVLLGEMECSTGPVIVDARIGFATEDGRTRYSSQSEVSTGELPPSQQPKGDVPNADRQLAKLRMACYSADSALGKPSKTVIHPLKAKNGLTHVKVELFTGRTHQIRLHCAHIGFPVLGDKLYRAAGQPEVSEAQYLRRARGQEEVVFDCPQDEVEHVPVAGGSATRRPDRIHIPRHLLHACELKLAHPSAKTTTNGGKTSMLTFHSSSQETFIRECPALEELLFK